MTFKIVMHISEMNENFYLKIKITKYLFNRKELCLNIQFLTCNYLVVF